MNTVALGINAPSMPQAGFPMTFQVSVVTFFQHGKPPKRGGYVGGVLVSSTDGSFQTAVQMPASGTVSGQWTPTRAAPVRASLRLCEQPAKPDASVQ